MSSREMDDSGSILTSSAVMAAGTMVSRASGFVRSALLTAALGTQLHADVFNIANTVPNMLYILLAGGIFNAVLVPQLVRAMENDADDGEGYTNRIITLAAVFLAGVTAVLVLLAPWLMQLFLQGFTPELAAQRDSVVDFARYCLPQVFFYGMFVLIGQVLNARGRFGPMMWAPIANNIISVAVLVAYLLTFGPAKGSQLTGAYTSHQELLLGLGSTLGIAVQLAILFPYLKSAGFTYRPRFDFRKTGLGHTLRLGGWTVLFVIVNQIAYTVVVRLAGSGTAAAASSGGGSTGTGYTVYANAFLLMMVPHSIATVSLATAMLPTLSRHAAANDLAGVARNVASTLRTSLALIVPFALLLPLISLDVSSLIWGYGAAAGTFDDFAPALSLFAPGLVFFTVHYLMLRGFYALELTRTVFWVQCGVAGTNIVLAIVFTRLASPENNAPGLVLAYGGAYLFGACTSYALLRRLLGGLETPVLLRFVVRLLIAAGGATLVTWAAKVGLEQLWSPGTGKVQAISMLALIGCLDVGVFLVLARAMRISEVTGVLRLITARRLRR